LLRLQRAKNQANTSKRKGHIEIPKATYTLVMMKDGA
jgi:hypothetical protein